METPAVTVNRFCGSGIEAISQAAQRLLLGEATMVLAGGMENMTQSPFVIRGARTGLRLGGGALEDSLMAGLTDSYCGLPMALTAEKLAEQQGITRKDADAYALRSQQAADAAYKACRMKEELVPVEVQARKEDDRGERRRSPAAGDDDGDSGEAAAVVQERRNRYGRERERHCGWGCGGRGDARENCEGTWTETCWAHRVLGGGGCRSEHHGDWSGAVVAKGVEDWRGLTLEQMDRVEVNEAFAAQYLAVEKVLGLNRDKTNVNGGAIALGHPLGASGTRLVITILNELRRNNLRYGLATACIGGGQGIAMVVEALYN